MQQLVIDIGNTALKLGLFADNVLVKSDVSSGDDEERAVKQMLEKLPKRILVSTVRNDIANIIVLLSNYFENKNLFYLTEKSPLPIVNTYSTPETLGNDRLANAVAANTMFPDQNCLVIDIGTCLKFDFVNAENKYLGGSISPGYQMRFKALHTYTGKLPLISPKHPNELIGSSTEASIRSGVYNGLLNEIEGMIESYQQKYQNLQCILTGGDAEIFAKALKNPIFADSFLTLKGLNTILNQYA